MRRLALLLAAVAIGGCQNSSEPLSLQATDLDVVGSFALVAAAGKSLPVVAGFTSTEEVDLVADTLVITAPNTWVETSFYVLTKQADGSQSTAQTASSGTYTVANGAINFQMTVGGTVTFTGSVTGKQLRLLYNGSSYLYARP